MRKGEKSINILNKIEFLFVSIPNYCSTSLSRVNNQLPLNAIKFRWNSKEAFPLYVDARRVSIAIKDLGVCEAYDEHVCQAFKGFSLKSSLQTEKSGSPHKKHISSASHPL